ncbi:MAG: hypothetical protein NT067_00470 [Candidatus Diapherotrites archaeon]|nr:hypothetical protein [Candidatus Diapherotrites archaeon]
MPKRSSPVSKPVSQEKMPLSENPFSGAPLPGFARFAAERTGVRLEKPEFKGKPMKAFRVRPTREQRALIVSGNLSGLPQFRDWKPEQIAKIVGEMEHRLYTSVDSREKIAKEMSGDKALAEKLGLKELAPKGFKVPVSLVGAIEEMTGARADWALRAKSVVSPRLKKLIFRQFDRFGVGVSVRVADKYGLGGRKYKNVMQSLRKEWTAKNKGKPRLYRSRLWRSVPSFVRIVWKLQNYHFNGAVKRIAAEEALLGEPISALHISEDIKGNKRSLALAMETDYWKELERKREIPSIYARVPFEEGFRKMLRAEGLGLKRDRAEAKRLRERVTVVFEALERQKGPMTEIARKTGEKIGFVNLVNAAFNVRFTGSHMVRGRREKLQ